jgi:acyl-CoA synthetase (AMP-forming)/AMP-acid ligase II
LVTLARDSVSDDPRTLVDLIRMRARLQPEFVGYRFLPDGDSRALELTYAELDRQARAIAARLQSRVPRGGRALLQIQSDLNFIVAFAGCLYAGVIPVPTMVPHRNRPIDGLCAIAEDCEPDIILTTAGILASMNPALTTAPALQGRPWLAVDAIATPDAGRADSDAWREVEIGRQEIAFLQYTSGSTSAPKGVMVSHANILHNQSMIRDACGHSERTVVVGWLPFFHDMGLIGNILQPLYLGVPCTLMPPAMVLQRPLRWLQAISRYRATTSGGPNFVYDLCVTRIKPEQAASLDLSSWCLAFNGSEPVQRETLERFSRAFAPSGFRADAFHACYGLAEATLRVCDHSAKPAPILLDVDADALERNRAVPANGAAAVRHLVGCGSASEFHDVQTVIADPATRRRMPEGDVGEIWIKGPNVAQGYWRNKQATERTFQARLKSGEGPFLRTGDLGFVHDGELFVSGRLKDMVIVLGRNIYPHDIELVVRNSDPALESCVGAAFIAEINGKESLIVAQEVRASFRRTIDPNAVRRTIRENIARHFDIGVQDIVLLAPGGVPRTTSGKVRRRACADYYRRDDWPAEKVDGRVGKAGPQSAIEATQSPEFDGAT